MATVTAEPLLMPSTTAKRIPWAPFALAAALGLLLISAIRHDRSEWPTFAGDEATYLMAAQSLGWDFDLRYSEADHARFAADFRWVPDGLILQSSDRGATLLYGKPPLYPLFIAPFVRFGGLIGAVVANTLLFSLAVVLASLSMRRRWGDSVWLWSTVFAFGTVTFAHIYWIHADLFSFSLALMALALFFWGDRGDEEVEQPRHNRDTAPSRARLVALGAGILFLAIVSLTRPVYATLWLPAWVALRSSRERRIVLTSGLVCVAALVASDFAIRGSLSSYTGHRQAFYSYTGFPTDSGSEWQERVNPRGNNSWVQHGVTPFGVDARRNGWNVAYLFFGRSVGLVPYFLPVFVALLGIRRRASDWALVLAVAVTVAAFLVMRPVNFYGGGGALANRYFLPMFAAFWFLGQRPRAIWPSALTLLVSAPMMINLWSGPDDYLRAEDGSYSYVSAFSRAVLPFETTQSHLQPSGREDFNHGDLWIRPLDIHSRNSEDTTRIELTGCRSQLLVGSSSRLDRLRLATLATPVDVLDIDGAEIEDAPGPRNATLRMERSRAFHRMWWDGHLFLYRLSIERSCEAQQPSLLFQLRRPQPPEGQAPKVQEPKNENATVETATSQTPSANEEQETEVGRSEAAP